MHLKLEVAELQAIIIINKIIIISQFNQQQLLISEFMNSISKQHLIAQV